MIDLGDLRKMLFLNREETYERRTRHSGAGVDGRRRHNLTAMRDFADENNLGGLQIVDSCARTGLPFRSSPASQCSLGN
jgi:hypothetical protein